MFLRQDISKKELSKIYNEFKDKLSPLNLEKKFARQKYSYDDKTNPLWYTFKNNEADFIKKFIEKIGLSNFENKITLSLLPVGYSLPDHTDFGRRTVIIIPILGYDAPVIIENEEVFYKDSPLLMDASKIHSVPTHTQDRIGIQISFKQSFKKIIEKINA